MAKPKKVHTSALCWVPAIESQPPIQTLRLVHDRQIGRWPPHVNVLYPFVPEAEFEAAAGRLAAALQPLPAFGVTLGRLDRFVHGRCLHTRAPAHAFHALNQGASICALTKARTHRYSRVSQLGASAIAGEASRRGWHPSPTTCRATAAIRGRRCRQPLARVQRTFLGGRAQRPPPSATLSRSYHLMGCVAGALQSASEE